MKTCPACSHSNTDDAKFCDACGADMASTADAQAAPEPPAPPAYVSSPTPPAYAPPAPPAYAPPAPVYPMATPMGAAAPAKKSWMPIVWGLVAIALVVGGYFAYTMLVKGPALTAAEYKTKVDGFMTQIQSAGTGSTEALQQISSTDAAERAAANAAWDAIAAQTRAGLAGIRGLVPPAELQAIHNRLVAGADATEKLIAVTDALYAKLASGEITSASTADTPEVKAFTDLSANTAVLAAIQDFTTAYNELKAK